jgi:hypothetical protein
MGNNQESLAGFFSHYGSKFLAMTPLQSVLVVTRLEQMESFTILLVNWLFAGAYYLSSGSILNYLLLIFL